MVTFSYRGKTYDVDRMGFLLRCDEWDEDFATGMAPQVSIEGGLTEKHWSVIRHIRDVFRLTGECPLVFQTCSVNKLSYRDFHKLFPTGYLRGACLLAGITYKDRNIDYYGESSFIQGTRPRPPQEKVYRVDVFGFLVEPSEWDEAFAVNRAYDMRISGGLGAQHWKIIHFLRDSYNKTHAVPTVVECCEANDVELDELERLFPQGYHRGAVKIAGLRVK